MTSFLRTSMVAWGLFFVPFSLVLLLAPTVAQAQPSAQWCFGCSSSCAGAGPLCFLGGCTASFWCGALCTCVGVSWCYCWP